MSYSIVVVFLMVFVGIYPINGDVTGSTMGGYYVPCEMEWGGRCFGTQETLHSGGWWNSYPPIFKCDTIIYDSFTSGCSVFDPEYACCVDCSRQTDACNREVSPNTVARNTLEDPNSLQNHCCANEFSAGQVYPDSGCHCCQLCKPKSKCKSRRKRVAECFNSGDSVYNQDWCLAQPGGKVVEKYCENDDCYCCFRDRRQ